MKHEKTITGQTYGRLTAIRFDRYAKERTYWIFRCICGAEKSQAASQVRRGTINSCGCLQKEKTRESGTTHGLTQTRIYKAWHNMISRCYRPSTKYFHRYGGRGIKVCEKWRTSFDAFFEDMGHPPQGCSLDRIDNDGDYEPINCRWADSVTQVANRSVSHFIKIDVENVLLKHHCQAIGISYNMVRKRLNRGWSMESALKVGPKK